MPFKASRKRSAFDLAAMNDLASNPSRSTEWRWLALWLVLLLPLALTFPPIPIDETRYLTAAWEMFNSGQWLVPTVDGAWYSDKSPLLFWLIVFGWKLVGVHTWVARVGTLVVSLGILLTLRRLAVRFDIGQRGPDAAMWLLAGCLGFVVFSAAIMFDLLLTLFVLAALHALLDLDRRKWARGVVALGIAVGLGLLAKGPVMLLHIAGAGLLAPFWSDTARSLKSRWYAALLAGLLIGVALMACWVIPAALYAGPSYWQPLLDKISGRITNSFAHNRPWWWYLPLVPLLVLPWLLTLRAPLAAWKAMPRERIGRFVFCWWLPPFMAFCAISGKQIHYLLPLLPAWMLGGAWLLQRDGARLRPGLLVLLALLAGAAIAALPWQAAHRFGYSPQPWAAVFAPLALIIAFCIWRAWGRNVRSLALAATTLISTAMLAFALSCLPALDVTAEASFVAQAQRAHLALVHVETSSGLFGYAGRLHEPVPWIPKTQVGAWCRAHPDGIVLTSEGHDEPAGAKPFRSWPYLLSGSKRIAAWRAGDVLAAARAGADSR
ncbi:MAG TPA: glycosyltransferase family 39 protein [Rhodanobacteraceae bacterium]